MKDEKLRSILIVDDEVGVRESLKMSLKKNYEVFLAKNAEEAFLQIKEHSPEVILLDVILPDLDSLKALEIIKQNDPHVIVIMITATKTAKRAVEAMRLGAFNYVLKPFNNDKLDLILSESLSTITLEQEVKNCQELDNNKFRNIIGKSKQMKDIFKMVKHLANIKSPVLIIGESGTGKQLLARAIHDDGQRAAFPFVTVDCSAISEDLLTIELFGHVKGAFTGAEQRKIGRFVQADRGTLFLAEISGLSLINQGKLLRCLEEQEFDRVGGMRKIKVDIRLITATNKALDQLIKKGSFREDFFYRISVVPIELPPLRERKEDIPLLIDHFVDKACVENNKTVKGVSRGALELMMQYEWPGNIEELETWVERVVALTSNEYIQPNELPFSSNNICNINRFKESVLDGKVSFIQAEEEFEREVILDALKKANYIQSHASEMLKISRRILKYKMDKLGIKNRE